MLVSYNILNVVLVNFLRLQFQLEHYVLTVKAQDGGTPSLSTTVTVYMNVLDVNDNAPVFDPSSYDCQVWENGTIGTSVLTVQATDLDSGRCASGHNPHCIIYTSVQYQQFRDACPMLCSSQ